MFFIKIIFCTIKFKITYFDCLFCKNFKSNKTIIAEEQKRKKWKFLFIKSDWFGKKYTERKTTSQCGNAETIIIDKLPKK